VSTAEAYLDPRLRTSRLSPSLSLRTNDQSELLFYSGNAPVCIARVLSSIPDRSIVAEVLCGCPQLLQANTGIVS
jgi:hypothetical protein